jgi:hypothetical protein
MAAHIEAVGEEMLDKILLGYAASVVHAVEGIVDFEE